MSVTSSHPSAKKSSKIVFLSALGALPVTVVFSLCTRRNVEMSQKAAVFLDKTEPVMIGEGLFLTLKSFWTVGSIVVPVLMLLYFIRFRSYLIGSIRLRDNIYLCSRIDMAFTIGLLRPRIYLPSGMEEVYREAAILHEQVHIKRKDVWMRYFAIGLLALFWFQPVLWLAYFLYENDMEEACDEAVLRSKGEDFRYDYAKALYEMTVQGKKVRGAILGFGSGAIKERIRRAATYRRESAKVRRVALGICILFILAVMPISWQVPQIMQERTEREDVLSLEVMIEDEGIEALITKEK